MERLNAGSGGVFRSSKNASTGVDGSGAADQITYWVDANTITGNNAYKVTSAGYGADKQVILVGTNYASIKMTGAATGKGLLVVGSDFGCNFHIIGATGLIFRTNCDANGGAGDVVAYIDNTDNSFRLGSAGTVQGILKLQGATSGTITIKGKAAAGTWTMTLPDNDGSANQVLTTDGSGITSWTDPGTAITNSGFSGAGTYTPTLTNQTNVAASTARQCMYSYVKDISTGNTIVTVSGSVDIDPTAAGGAATELRISLPAGLTPAFSDIYEAAGVANSLNLAGVNGNSAAISAVAAGDTVALKFDCADLANTTWRFTFQYIQTVP